MSDNNTAVQQLIRQKIQSFNGKAFRVISLDQIKYLACGNDTFGSKDTGE